MNRRIDDFRSDVQERFDQVDKRFDQVDKRFDQVDKRFELMDKRMDRVETRSERQFEHLSKAIDASETELGKRMDGLYDMMLTVNQVKLQGASLMAALAATAAVVGTFLLQLYTLL